MLALNLAHQILSEGSSITNGSDEAVFSNAAGHFNFSLNKKRFPGPNPWAGGYVVYKDLRKEVKTWLPVVSIHSSSISAKFSPA